jgi:hypothetical protein
MKNKKKNKKSVSTASNTGGDKIRTFRHIV